MTKARALAGWRLQLTVVLLAGILWSAYPRASLWAWLAAYGLAWLLLNVARAVRPGWLRPSLSRGQAWALAAALALVPVTRAAGLVGDLVENEGLEATDHLVAARHRLGHTPSIAPPLVASDRPQTFYVHAPGAHAVALTLGEDGTRLEAARLGHGLHRLTYDPRRDGALDAPDGPFEVTLETDGEPHGRRMWAVTPLAHPRWLAPAPDRDAVAAVSEETDELVVVDAEGLRWRATVGDGPTDVAWLDAARLAVTHRYDDALWIVRAADGEVVARRALGPFQRRLAVGEGRLAVARGGSHPELVVLTHRRSIAGDALPDHGDPDHGAPDHGAPDHGDPDHGDPDHGGPERVALPYRPDWIAFGPDDRTLVVSSRRPAALHRYARTDGGWREDAPPLQLGRPAVTLARAPGGRRLVVAVTDYRPEGPPHLGNHFVDDQLLRVDVIGWRVVGRRPTATRTSRQESPGNVDRGVSPMGIDVRADGAMRVAFAGTDDVWRYPADDAVDPVPQLVALDTSSATPFSAVELADGRFVVSSPVYGTLAIHRRDGSRQALIRLAPGDRALLQENERALQRRIGERTFHEATRAGVSCQSCHLHGQSDGARHNIGGATLVATLDVRGLAGTPPYLRDGGYPLLGSLDELSQTLYRGYLRAQGGRRLSLDRHLSALPRPIPPRQLEGRDEARERRGLDAFVKARCVLCHAFPAFTNLGQHPAQSLFPRFAATHADTQLDTPSLFALDGSAPYLVDGRAQTLAAIFREHDPTGRHGDTARLSERELEDLVHFLGGL